jgi:polar amino acid transport system substrate-binding protein
MLMAGRTQVVISDFRIFLHFKKLVEEQFGKKVDVEFHPLFAPTPYRVAFRNRSVRDAFDAAMAFLKRSGEYDEIIAKYLSQEDLDQF